MSRSRQPAQRRPHNLRRLYTLQDVETGVTVSLPRGSLRQARRRAQEWVGLGSYDVSGGTVWVCIRIMSRFGVEQIIDVILDPDEPPCPAGKHDWQTPREIVGGMAAFPGVFANEGGLLINECCVRCGARKVVDTWALRPDTGERAKSVRYYGPGHYDLLAAEEDAEWADGTHPAYHGERLPGPAAPKKLGPQSCDGSGFVELSDTSGMCAGCSACTGAL